MHMSLCLMRAQIRRSMAKLELYRRFTNSLAVSVLVSVAWIGYEVSFVLFSVLVVLYFFRLSFYSDR